MSCEASEEIKNPYVLLERWSEEEINCYLAKIGTRDDCFEDSNNLHANDSNHNNDLPSNEYFVDQYPTSVFGAYVLLERLRPQDIQHLLPNDA